MAEMIKFYRGLAEQLPASGANGAFYVTTDEGGIYLGTGTGMKRLGDFVQVDNVAALPAKAHESCLYYCVAENILAKWNGTDWKQINKQPTAAELKTLLGLGSAAYTDADAYDAAGSAKAVRDYVGEIPEGYTEETIVAYINKKAEETLNAASGGSSESAASVLAALNTYKAENDPKVNANTEAIAAITKDYLKLADKEALQAQINLIMNNPDTENVINSIEEFTQYIKDHGTIAEGFRKDIDANAKAIDDHEALAAETYETKDDAADKLAEAKGYADDINTALDARLQAVEADQHTHANQAELDKIVEGDVEKWNAAQANAEATAAGALAAAKSELEGKITSGDTQTLADAQAYTDELANGAVATNAGNIAALIEQMTWGEFPVE